MRRTADQTREHILETAHELFYWQGIRSTGVDRIAAAAEIAPTTLYRLFASKDDLIAAYVERAGVLYRGWFTEVTAGTDARERILALFDAIGEQTQPARCRGCPFLMSLAELPDPNGAAHQHSVAVKAWVRDQLGALCAELGVSDPDELADELVLVMEGVYASVQALGVDGPARRARGLVDRLITGAR